MASSRLAAHHVSSLPSLPSAWTTREVLSSSKSTLPAPTSLSRCPLPLAAPFPAAAAAAAATPRSAFHPLTHSAGCDVSQAVASGSKFQEAMNWLEKRMASESRPTDSASTIQTAIMCMQHVLSSDFKGSDLELGVVEAGQRFRMVGEVCPPAHPGFTTASH